jgi:CBS domain-containing protein
MTSTGRLREDHQVIGRLLEGIEAAAGDVDAGGSQPLVDALRIVDGFVERYHHAKEELGLFPLLETRGLPVDVPLARVRSEHEDARRLLRALCDVAARVGREPGSAEVLRGLIGAYVALMRQHMAKEDALLFPYAERVLSREDDLRVQEVFARLEPRDASERSDEVLQEVAAALERMAARRPRRAPSPPPGPAVAADVMRANVPAVRPDDSLARAAELMESLGVRELPVVDQGLVGILAAHDLRPHFGHYEWTRVRAAMTADPVTVGPDAPLVAVARLLLAHGFNAVPVAANGRLLGMVGRGDLVRVVAGARTIAPAISPPRRARRRPAAGSGGRAQDR